MRLWIAKLPMKKYDEVIEYLLDLGFTDVIVGYNLGQVIAVKDRGMRAHFLVKPFRLTKDQIGRQYALEDPLGRKHIWNGMGCPNHPELKERSLKFIEEIMSGYEINGVVLDGANFPSFTNGINTFTTCFCEHCENKAKEMGYDFKRMKEDVEGLLKEAYRLSEFLPIFTAFDYGIPPILSTLIEYPGVIEWLSFRSACIVEYTKEMFNVISSFGRNVEYGAILFPPTLAWLIGQDYHQLSYYLDFIQPIIYRSGTSPSCLNFELYSLIGELLRLNRDLDEESVMRFVYSLFNVLHYNPPSDREELREKGLSSEMLSYEYLAAKELVRERIPVYPRVEIGDEEIVTSIKNLKKQHLEGISITSYEAKLKSRLEEVVKIIKLTT